MDREQEVFICAAARTPFGRYGGALAAARPDDLAAQVLQAVLQRSGGLDPQAIDEVVLGCANQAGEDNRNAARMALLLAGLPESVPGLTVNRLCASGLDAVALAARQIRCGEAELVLAGGVESMSRAPYVMGKAGAAFARDARLEDTTLGWRFVNPRLRERCGVDTMSETAENVAQEFNVTRAAQDAYALQSQQRCAAAQRAGFHDEEIAAVDVPGERGRGVRVTQDEHPRPDSTAAALAALKPLVRADGSVTAGNSSGINDGAAALLLASAAAVRRHGLVPRARVLGTQAVGVAPRLMGIGPVEACRRLLQRLGLTTDQLALIEINEAFAAQVLAVLQQLGVAADDTRVNPNGGAIALGHPLGASGARLVLTATGQLQRSGGRHALVSLCVGVGQGVAMMLEKV